MDKGWIKLYRKFTQWEWYDDINVKVLFLHLLLTANYEDKKWHGITIKRGELITSEINLAKQTKMTRQKIRNSLRKLEFTNEIIKKTTNEYTHLTVCNYNTYQSKENEVNQRTTNEQPTNNQRTTTTKELKELNNKHILNKWISENLSFVTKIKTQLTTKNCEKLLESYSINEIQDVLWQMENKPKIETKYNTVYLTLLNWLKINYGKRGINGKNVKHSEQNSGVGNPKVEGKRKEKDFESSKGTFFDQ